MRHLDLFSGIGGFALAARWMGWETVQFVEIDPFCQKVLKKHWPEVPIHDDIQTYTGGTADIVTGGFPCQDISYAGKGAGIDGERSGLWSELCRVIGEVRPRYAVLENVAALLGRGLDRVTGDLAEIGYDCEWHCIPASAVGAPHRRDRIWITAYPQHPNPHSTGSHQTEVNLNGSPELRDEQERESGSVCGDVSDTDLPRLEGWFGRSLQKCSGEWFAWSGGIRNPNHEDESGCAVSGITGAGLPQYAIWQFEPNVGRVVDGLSLELDFTRQIRDWRNEQSNTEKAIPTRNELVAGFLRAMWKYRKLAETSPELYIRKICDSVPEVPLRDSQSRWLLGPRIEKDKGLRDMWCDFYAEPFKEAQNLQFKLLERARSAKRSQTVGSRVDRLRSLGNAIVPQVAYTIFKAL